MKRNQSIDFMRGLVMIIMALDHVRDLMHVTSLTQSPTDLSFTTPVLFFTRWITYLCAPTFVFLSGTSAFLSMQSKNDVEATRAFLFKRGLWLIVLEFTVVNFGMWFDVKFSFLIFEVIAAIGFSFLILGLLINIPARTIGLIGVGILVCHNFISFTPAISAPFSEKILASLFAPGAFPYGNGKLFFMGYPPIPWLGIMLTGFGAGHYFTLSKQKQRVLFFRSGLIAIGLFFLLRLINIYGDPAKWSVQKSALFSILSFLNVSKYPPSLQFSLLFLGIMLLVVALVQGVNNKFTTIVCTYGKTPLFYFLVHWYIIHPLVFIMIFLQGFTWGDMVFGSSFGRPKTGSGIELWAVYLVWAGLVLLMYPLCKWFGKYKQRHKEKSWLRYI
ncbi:DUF1624 domain-containing protein [Mucilaginibacter calamicampi]|uniref:DUF1624 domain-containing protein n=1 Tax=Mucilaginibacter calamicampi TaxID=1302352 RepID=A0ABW2YZI5_9SPHI